LDLGDELATGENNLISRPAGGQKLYVNSVVNLDKKLYSGKSKVYISVAYLREIDYPDSFLFHEASSRHTLGTKGISRAHDHAQRRPFVDRLLHESTREEPPRKHAKGTSSTQGNLWPQAAFLSWFFIEAIL